MAFNRDQVLGGAERIDSRPLFMVNLRELPAQEDQELIMGLGQTALMFPEMSFRMLGGQDPDLFQTVEDFLTNDWNERNQTSRAIKIALTDSRHEHISIDDLVTVSIAFLQLSKMVFRAGLDRAVTYDQGTLGSIQKAVEYIEKKPPEQGGGKVQPNRHRVLSLQLWLRHNWLWSEQQRRLGINPPQGSGEVFLLPS